EGDDEGTHRGLLSEPWNLWVDAVEAESLGQRDQDDETGDTPDHHVHEGWMSGGQLGERPARHPREHAADDDDDEEFDQAHGISSPYARRSLTVAYLASRG